jgi:hypothetical protein
MYSKKKLQKLKQQFERDNDFGNPYHKSGSKSLNRNAFINKLIQNEDFVPTQKANDKKYADSMRNTAKLFTSFDYAIIAIFAAASIMLTPVVSYSILQNTKTVRNHKNIALAAFAALSVLVGCGAGFVVATSLNQANKESAVANCYKRISVRLFDMLHETHPDLDEKVLRACNPEMSRVIKELLIANMSENDVREIEDLSVKFSQTIHELMPNNEAKVLEQCNDILQQVISIIDQNLVTNPQLNDTLIAIYRGNIPVHFILKNQQNTQ